MTEERMALKALREKTSDADVLNEMIGFAANRLMALEADRLITRSRNLKVEPGEGDTGAWQAGERLGRTRVRVARTMPIRTGASRSRLSRGHQYA
jgi:hypothetical protein